MIMNSTFCRSWALALILVAPAVVARAAGTDGQKTETVDIMSDPDHFAWKLFCEITAPGDQQSTKAGWESWISAFRLFADPTTFNFLDPRAGKPNQPLDLRFLYEIDSAPLSGATDSGQLLADHVGMTVPRKTQSAKSKTGDRPFILQPEPTSDTFREDVALNPEAVKYVIEQGLISENQQEGRDPSQPINFPKEAKEIKILWRKLTDDADYTRYYCQIDKQGTRWGLQSLHITTKDIPNWFWATFEHKDNFGGLVTYPPFSRVDSFGFKNDANGVPQPTDDLKRLMKAYSLPVDLWTNYRLTGSQVDFTDGTGMPVIRGNNMIEGRLPGNPATQCSCMTCHARSTIGNRLDFHLGDDRVGAPNFCRWQRRQYCR